MIARKQEEVHGKFPMQLDVAFGDQTLHCTKLDLWTDFDYDDPDDLVSEAFCTVHYQDGVDDHPYNDQLFCDVINAWFEHTHPDIFAKLEAPLAFTEAGMQGRNYAHLIAGAW